MPTSSSSYNPVIDLTNDNGWTEVKRKQRRSSTSGFNSQQNTIPKQKSIFWSKLDKNFDNGKAANYIISNGIADASEFKLTCLTKDESSSYVSYKIDTTDSASEKIMRYKTGQVNHMSEFFMQTELNDGMQTWLEKIRIFFKFDNGIQGFKKTKQSTRPK